MEFQSFAWPEAEVNEVVLQGATSWEVPKGTSRPGGGGGTFGPASSGTHGATRKKNLEE